MEKNKKTITIPEKLYERLEQTAKNLGFENINEYITFILEELVRARESEKELSEDEVKHVNDGLKKLGYKE